MKQALLIGVVLLGAAAAASAHDLKVLASHLLLPRPGERTTVYLSWGHALPIDDLVDAQTIERYDLLLPSGSAVALKKTDVGLQTNVVEIEQEGITQVVVSRKPSVITFVLDKDGGRTMKRGPKTGVTEGTIDHALRSQQFAKALLVAGPAKNATVKPVGQALEIVPLDTPPEWRSGGLLCFQVLFQGKPAAGENVQATYVGHRPENAWCYATTTGRDGVATVRVAQPGTWVLRVNVRKPATGSTREQYDYESYNATLALEVRP